MALDNLAAGSYTLSFGPGTTFTFLDNVVLEARGGTSVPDAGETAGLLALEALGLAWFTRRNPVRGLT